MTARRPGFGRWLAAPIAAVALVAGVWVAGGVITDDFRLAMALTAVWGLLTGIACIAIGRRRRPLLVPALAGYLITAAVVGGFLAYTTLHDDVVNEDVVTGVPATQAAQPRKDEDAKAPAPKRNVQLAAAKFESLEHDTVGKAAVVELPSGKRKLTFTGFETSAGPDLRVRLAIGDTTDGGSDGAIDLGALKGNKGDQQYELPARADLDRYKTVVVWCRAFSAGFAKATFAD